MKIVITILALAISQLLNAQLNPVDIKAIEKCTGDPNIYQLEILLKANEESVETYVAEQNFRLTFNTDAIDNPRIAEEGALFSGIIQNGATFSIYDVHHLNGSLGNTISYNVVLQGGTGTLLSKEEWTLVGVLEFDVLNRSMSKSITWLGQMPDDFPPTVIINNLDATRTVMETNFYPTETAGNNTTLLNAFGRSWQHPCLANEGWLKLDWKSMDDVEELFVSIDGGLNFNSVASSSGQFLATNLSAGDYDIQIKLLENDCPVILDDVNLANLGFEATMEHDFSCAENTGFITVNWPPSPYTNAIKISINGGKRISVNDELGTYTFNALKAGSYDVKIFNKSGSCTTDLGIATLTGNNDAPEITRSWKHSNCDQNDGSITLSWVDNPNVEQVQISTDGGNTFTSMPTAQQSHTVENLGVGDYDIWIKWGVEADACAIQLDDVNLINNAPANIGLEMQYSCENKQMSLIDSGYAGESLRQFKYRTFNGSDWNNWTTTDFVQEEYFDISGSVEGITEIQYRFKVRCDETWSMWSAPKISGIPQCKLRSTTNFLPVTVAPNPFNKRFLININNSLFKTQMAKIELTNLIGKIVYTKKVDLKEGENSFNVELDSSINAGIYLANILLDDGTKQTIKLLKK